MSRLSALVMLLAVVFAPLAAAQNWVVYVPVERDFRVLFPSPPSRSTAQDGSEVFRSRFESGDDQIEYVVYRLPATYQALGTEAQQIQQRLQSRTRDDVAVRALHEEDAGPMWERHMYRYRNTTSIHRLVGAPGRYYELEVVMPRGRTVIALQSARDFFNSFQATGVSLPSLITGLGQNIANWCQTRTDPFTRAFCEFSACLQPGLEQNPRCAPFYRR